MPLALGVLVFFGCLQGVHRQLLAARRYYLEWAGQLYARAYEPIRSGSLVALGEQAQLLQAAELAGWVVPLRWRPDASSRRAWPSHRA